VDRENVLDLHPIASSIAGCRDTGNLSATWPRALVLDRAVPRLALPTPACMWRGETPKRRGPPITALFLAAVGLSSSALFQVGQHRDSAMAARRPRSAS
jgi:hypothetical protein